MAELIRCRVTMNLQGGARLGDVVLVDPDDPWFRNKISVERGPLVPLDPWPPEDKVAEDANVNNAEDDEEGPIEDASVSLQAAPRGAAPSTLDDSTPDGDEEAVSVRGTLHGSFIPGREGGGGP